MTKRDTVNTKRNWTIVGMGVFWILTLLVVPFIAQPGAATARTSALDIARIDTFVRDQVQRHGIPGLALGIVEGDRIIHLGGYGSADQSGRAVDRKSVV